jgi:hypothetical protein
MASIVSVMDIEIEAEFLASVLRGSKCVDRALLRHLEPEYFSIDSYKWAASVLQEREWKPLPYGLLDQELLVVLDEDDRAKYRDQVGLLYQRDLTFDAEASDRFKAFVSYCTANSSITEAFKGFGRSNRLDLLLKEVSESTSLAKGILEGESLSVHDLAEEHAERNDRRREERDNPNLNPRVLFGIPGLDEQFRVKAPMLVDFLAPFKRFKSIILNALGYSFLLQGFNVLHLTYENSYELTSDRYDSMFSGLGYDRVSNLLLVEEERHQVDRMWNWIQSWDNRLKIIKCHPKQTTVHDVADRVKRLQDEEGWSPDVGVWDYLNIIAPTESRREERLEQGQIVWDLKGFAEDFNVAQFTASQSTMEGATVDRMGFQHRGKSIDISQGMDMSIAIDQTPEERREGILVLSPQFARNAEITIPEVVLDTDIPRMQIDPCLHKLWDYAARLHSF